MNEKWHQTRNYKRHCREQRRKLPLALLLAADVLAAALLLGVFYVTNYMIQREIKPVDLPRPSAATTHPVAATHDSPTDTGSEVSAAATGTAIQTATTSPADPNDWRAKFTGKFTDGAVEKTENSYRSANINITVKEIEKYGATCFIADIYVAELKYFRTAFAKKPDVMGARELTDKVAAENGAILAITGDHCIDNVGAVVRNGRLYRDNKASCDFFAMNYEGSMQAFSPDTFDIKKIKSDLPYQVWAFGPMLLQDGQAMTEFNATHGGKEPNPRTAVGYFEPGHYCFVVVGGRLEGYAEGYTLKQLSQLMYDLGCKEAYNLDGGRSSEMIFLSKMLNRQVGRRPTPDILYIADN